MDMHSIYSIYRINTLLLKEAMDFTDGSGVESGNGKIGNKFVVPIIPQKG